jgi:LysR family transcriptional regulator of abg operon
MKINQIQTIVAIADTGSIRAAARTMNISQSALTRNMRELEEEFSAELIHRTYKGVEFTPAGQALLTRARFIIESMELAKDEVAFLKSGSGMSVRIGITPVVATTFFPTVFKQFNRQLPETEITMVEGLLTEIVPKLLEGRLDFGIAIASPKGLPPELTLEPISQIELSVAGREGHPLEHVEDWRELLDSSWILNQVTASSSNLLIEWIKQNGLPMPSSIVQCTSPFLMLEMMRRTDLIGYGPTQMFNDKITGSGVTVFKISPRPPSATLGIIRLKATPLSPVAKQLQTLVMRNVDSAY